jgi:ABC-type multidrug transport system permease subunit
VTPESTAEIARSNAGPGRGLAASPLAQLTLARFRETWREPEAVFWIFLFPVIMAGGLGLAFRNRPAEVYRIAVTDAQLVKSFEEDKALNALLMTPAEGQTALRTGRVVLLVSPSAESKGVIYQFDDTIPEARTARVIADRAVQRAAGVRDAVPASDEYLREPGSRYIDFVVPGLLGMNLMGGGIWGIGFTIVDSRRRKLLKRLIASPMKKSEYLGSFLISRLLMTTVEITVLLAFARIVFGVPFRGPLWQLALLCVLSSLMFSAIGLLIASRARTIEAVSGLMNVTMMPMWILSGVFFSPERFPDVMQPLIRALPLTPVIDGLRANMLQGIGLASLTWQLPVILGWLVVCFASAMWLFRWR